MSSSKSPKKIKGMHHKTAIEDTKFIQTAKFGHLGTSSCPLNGNGRVPLSGRRGRLDLSKLTQTISCGVAF